MALPSIHLIHILFLACFSVGSIATSDGPGATQLASDTTSPTARTNASEVKLHNNVQSSGQFMAKAKLDINQKVYIEGVPTLGDGSGQASLNKCTFFAPQHVSSPDKPHVKVCGTGIKMTAYLMGECQGYYTHSKVIGKCQSSMPPDTCDEYSPAQDARFGAYQSYKIEPC